MAGINPVGYNPALSAIRQQSYYASKVSAAYSAAANPSQPNAPVEPVSAVRRVTPDASVRVPVVDQEQRIPSEAELNNASDNLARMRIQYPEDTEKDTEQRSAQAMAQLGVSAY